MTATAASALAKPAAAGVMEALRSMMKARSEREIAGARQEAAGDETQDRHAWMTASPVRFTNETALLKAKAVAPFRSKQEDPAAVRQRESGRLAGQ